MDKTDKRYIKIGKTCICKIKLKKLGKENSDKMFLKLQ